MKQLLIIGSLLFLSWNSLAQFAALFDEGNFIRLENDSAILFSDKIYRGEIVWQKSTDSITWINTDSSRFIPKQTAFYRMKIDEGTCNPITSSPVKIYSKNTSVSDYRNLGVTTKEFISNGVDIGQMLEANISVQELMDNGIHAKDIFEAGGRVPGFSCDSTLSFGTGWRAEANRMINKFRKSNLEIKVVDTAGNPIENARVEIRLKRHKFIWGAVVTDQFMVSPYSDIYKQTFLKYFNGAGFSLSLKPKWPGTETERLAAEALPWFRENNIYMRGHALIWEGESYLHPDLKAVYQSNNLSNKEKGDSLVALATGYFHHALEKWDVD